MASKSAASDRSETLNVTDPKTASALAAAWRGVHEFFGGRVQNWEVNPPTEEHPDGTIAAMGFSVYAKYSPEKILADISGRDRRLTFQPFASYVAGAEPAPFTDAQDMTNWSVLYLKGSVEEGTSKTPEYARTAIAEYKAAHGLKSRRGPKLKVIRLDNINEIDVNDLPQDQLDAILALAQRITPAAHLRVQDPVTAQ